MDTLDVTPPSGRSSPGYTPEPPPTLALCHDYLSDAPMTLKMKGHATNPDFEVCFYHGSTMFHVETTHNRLKQQTFITDGKCKTHLKTLVKQEFGDTWQYSINLPGQHGTKLLEFNTRRDMLAGASTPRMVFRNIMEDELDALDLRVVPGSDAEECDILYQGKKIAEIHRGNCSKPELILDILVPGVDPLLIVIMAIALDDHTMSARRRRRRSVKNDLKVMAFGGNIRSSATKVTEVDMRYK